ncbi:MAG TPA: vitamin K epoxide reductase family protein [Patescibacteria group bacterium]|nr:vitamin K epoxide reductase family protein [Patescibacteria group bacterium]
MMFSNILIIMLAVTGFSICLKIFHEKRKGRPLTCPLKFDCEAVVKSDYSKFFGIPLEILGCAYYALMGLSYLFIGVTNGNLPQLWILLLMAMTLVAFFFSLYLTFIQAVALKQWCTWCLGSAGVSTMIFFLSVTASNYQILELLIDYKRPIIALHLIGTVLGLGGATITDIFFFKFLKDFRISKKEKEIMDTLSQIIWFGLAVLLLSGIGLYLPNASALNATPKFLVKMIIVCIIILNGAVMNILIAPQLVKLSFKSLAKKKNTRLILLRRLSFALGAISITSWYSALILGVTPKDVPIPFLGILSLYIAALIVAILCSQFYERYLVRMANNQRSGA